MTRLRLPFIDLILIIPSAAFGVASAWTGYWPGAAFFGGCALVVPALRWYVDRPRRAAHVTFDSIRVVRTMRDGRKESIDWVDVARIAIVTTNAGPAVEDVYWEFSSADGNRGCLVANGADGIRELIAHVQAFPGFDNLEMAKAMGSARNAEFVVWERNHAAAA